MAYYVTGFYRDTDESGYYIYDSMSQMAKKLSNKLIKSNSSAIKDIVNARLGGTASLKNQILIAKRLGIQSTTEYRPAIIENGNVIDSNKTLVYIDFEQEVYGVVNYDGTSLTWHPLMRLTQLPKATPYNNTIYSKKTGILDLKAYHIIGKEKAHDIILTNYKAEEHEEQANSNSNTEKLLMEIDEAVERIKYEENNSPSDKEEDVDNIKKWLWNKNQKSAVKNLKMTPQSFYETMIYMLRDDDVITIPRWMLKALKFKLYFNLDKTMNLDKMVSLGTIQLSSSNQPMMVIVKIDDTVDYIKIQLIMSGQLEEGKTYSPEAIREDYLKWRVNSKYVSL